MVSDKGKTVVSLFSGGDAPGMNSFLRGLVRVGLNRYGAAVLGAKDGYDGLVRTCRRMCNGKSTLERLGEEIDAQPGRAGLDRRGQNLVRFDHRSVSGILGRGEIGNARFQVNVHIQS